MLSRISESDGFGGSVQGSVSVQDESLAAERLSTPARGLTTREARILDAHQQAFAVPEPSQEELEQRAAAAAAKEAEAKAIAFLGPNGPGSTRSSRRPRRDEPVVPPGPLARVLAPNVVPDTFDHFWHASLAMTEPLPEPEPPPPPEPEPPTPPSSDLDDELSEEETELLGAMLTAMPHLNAPGLSMAVITDPAGRCSTPQEGETSPTRMANAPTPAVSSTLLRLARLNKAMSAAAKEGPMISAMFEAARVGAESLDAHASLRASLDPAAAPCGRSMSDMLSWNSSPQVKYSAALEEKQIRVQRAAAAAAALAARNPKKAAALAAAAAKEQQQQGSGVPGPKPGTPSSRKDKGKVVDMPPRPGAPDSMTVVVHGSPILLDSSDPGASANSRMASDLVAAAGKAAAAEAAKLLPPPSAAAAGRRGASAAGARARPTTAKASMGFMTHVPAPEGPPVADGAAGKGAAAAGAAGPAGAVKAGAVGAVKAGALARPDTAPAVVAPPVVHRKSLAEMQAERLELRMSLAEAKHGAVQAAMVGTSPLKAKAARPMSSLSAMRPTSAMLHPSSFEAARPLLEMAGSSGGGGGAGAAAGGPSSPGTPAGAGRPLVPTIVLRRASVNGGFASDGGAGPASPAGVGLPPRPAGGGSAGGAAAPGSPPRALPPRVSATAGENDRRAALAEHLTTATLPSDAENLGQLYGGRPTSAAIAHKALKVAQPANSPGFSRPQSALDQNTTNASLLQLQQELADTSGDEAELPVGLSLARGSSQSEDTTASSTTGTFTSNPCSRSGSPATPGPVDITAAWGAAPTSPSGRGGDKQRMNLLKATRAARELDMMMTEEANARASGPTDTVGEAGRLLRRYYQQVTVGGSPNVFNLAHSLRSIDQVAALAEVLPQLPQITALVLADNDLIDGAVQILVAALSREASDKVGALDLGQNKLSVSAIKALCPLLLDPAVQAAQRPASPEHDPVDTLLGIAPPAPAPPPVSALPLALHRSAVGPGGAVLRELLLGGNTGLGDAAAELLSAVLMESCCALRVLDLGKVGLGERGATALGRALAKTSCLEVLDLSWNALGVRGSQAVATGLKAAYRLSELYLSWTGAGDQGASYVVAALQHNSTLKVLDLSGNNVSADTCMVLQESLKVNTSLTTLILRDNPLGQVGARRLLRAVHDLGGALSRLDLMGCTFQGSTALPGEGAIMPVPLFNPNQPDGLYSLDLELPAHLQVAYELLALAGEQGVKTWKNATLNGKPYKLISASRHLLPDKGTLALKFTSISPLLYTDTPITDQEFNFVWMSQVYPGGVPQHNPYATTARDMARASVHRTRGGAAGGAQSPTTANGRSASGPGGMTPTGGPDSGGLSPRPPSSPPGGPARSRLASATGTPPAAAPVNGAVATAFSRFMATRPVAALEGDGVDPLTLANPNPPKAGPRTSWAAGETGGGGGVAGMDVRQSFPGLETDEGAVVSELNNRLLQAVMGGGGPTSSGGGGDDQGSAGGGGGVFELLPRGASGGGGAVPGDASPVAAGAVRQSRVQSEGGASITVFEKGLSGTNAPTFSQVKGATDSWKMNLLGAITSEGYLRSTQLVQVLDALHDSATKTQAAVQCFGKLTDPENAHLVLAALDPSGAAQFLDRLGDLITFHPANPTGCWQLLLSHPVANMVAKRLLLAATQQHDLGLCRWPFHTCLVQCSIDGKAVDTENPHYINLPREGMLKMNFVDLRPVPTTAKPLTSQQMSALVSALTHETALQPRKVVASIDSAGLSTVVDVLARWGAAGANSSSMTTGGAAMGLSSNVAALRAAASRAGGALSVRDPVNFMATMRMLAVSHYVTCDQLMELMGLMPYHDNTTRIELVSTFWARTVDKSDHWTDVMRRLSEAGQVMAAQRLGYCNIFNPKRPSLHYRLRMFRPDEHEIAWQLFNMAVEAPQECFTNTTIDGEVKKMNEGSSIWPVMRGSAKDGTPPTCTIEFDFNWPERTPKSENKAVQALKDAFKARRNEKLGIPAAPDKNKPKETAKLVSVPLRKSVAKKPDKPVVSAPGGPPKLSPLERDLAEGVVLTTDGKLRRLLPQGSMKFFQRTASGQAGATAARALWERDDVKENVGTFGYHLSNAGGLLLDRSISNRLCGPRAALAQGQMPGNLQSSPWDDTAFASDDFEGSSGPDSSRPGSPLTAGPPSPTSRSRLGNMASRLVRTSLQLDALDTAESDTVLLASPGGGGGGISGAIMEADIEVEPSFMGGLSPGGRVSLAGAASPGAQGRVSMPGSPGGMGKTTALLAQMGPSPRAMRVSLANKLAPSPPQSPLK